MIIDVKAFEKEMIKLIATVIKKCKKERRKKNGAYRKTPRQRIKTLS